MQIAQLLGNGEFVVAQQAGPMQILQLLGDGGFQTYNPGEEMGPEPIQISQLLGDGGFKRAVTPPTKEQGPLQILQLFGDGAFGAAQLPGPMEISQLLGDGSFNTWSTPAEIVPEPIAISQLRGDGSFVKAVKPLVPDNGPMQISQLLSDGNVQAVVPTGPLEISQLLGDGSIMPDSKTAKTPAPVEILQLMGDGKYMTKKEASPMEISQLLGNGFINVTKPVGFGGESIPVGKDKMDSPRSDASDSLSTAASTAANQDMGYLDRMASSNSARLSSIIDCEPDTVPVKTAPSPIPTPASLPSQAPTQARSATPPLAAPDHTAPAASSSYVSIMGPQTFSPPSTADSRDSLQREYGPSVYTKGGGLLAILVGTGLICCGV